MSSALYRNRESREGDADGRKNKLERKADSYIDSVNELFNPPLVSYTNRSDLDYPALYSPKVGIKIHSDLVSRMRDKFEADETVYNSFVKVIGHELCHAVQFEVFKDHFDDPNDTEIDMRAFAHASMFNEAQASLLTGSGGYEFREEFYAPVLSQLIDEEYDLYELLESHPLNRSFIGFKEHYTYGTAWKAEKISSKELEEFNDVKKYEEAISDTFCGVEGTITVIDYGHPDVPTDDIVGYMQNTQQEIEALFYRLTDEGIAIPDQVRKSLFQV